MPRKLPWLVKDESKTVKNEDDVHDVPERHTKAKSSSSKRPKDESDSEGIEDDDAPPSAAKKARDRARLMIEPPEEEFMIDGYDADDGWRMVEDEFFMTARLFTAHLHAAEYNRLKKQAQEEETSSFYKRREDIVASTAIKAMLPARTSNKQGKQRAVKIEETGDDDDPFMRDETLAAMMNRERSSSKFEDLVTRRPAAASFAQRPKEVTPQPNEGWTGIGAQQAARDELDMDLDNIPAGIVRRSDMRKPNHLTSTDGDSALLEAHSPMWIGGGQNSGSTIVKPAQTQTITGVPVDSEESRLTAADEDLPGLKRTSLDPKVLARLARRRQLATEAESKAGEPG